MTLTTNRTRLRLINISDLKAIHQLHSLPQTDEFNTLGIPVDIQETKSIIKPWIEANKQSEITNYTFAIEDHISSEFIGLFGLKLWSSKHRRGEVWYKIHPDYWGKVWLLNHLMQF